MLFTRNHLIDLLVLLILLAAGVGFSFMIESTSKLSAPLISIAAITIPSVFYLGLRSKKNWSKIFNATFLFGFIFGFIFTFFAEVAGAWKVLSVLVPGKIFGLVAIDSTLSLILITVLTLVFYEHFVDDEKDPRMSKWFPYAVLPGTMILVGIIVMFFVDITFFDLPYAYLVLGLLGSLPPILIGIYKPSVLKKMLITGSYFAGTFLLIAMISSILEWRTFPGQYVGGILVAGSNIPFEEVIFFVLFYASSLVSYYEIFVDDGR